MEIQKPDIVLKEYRFLIILYLGAILDAIRDWIIHSAE